MLAGPINLRVLANLQQQVQLLGKELVIVLQIESEQRIRFDE